MCGITAVIILRFVPHQAQPAQAQDNHDFVQRAAKR